MITSTFSTHVNLPLIVVGCKLQSHYSWVREIFGNFCHSRNFDKYPLCVIFFQLQRVLSFASIECQQWHVIQDTSRCWESWTYSPPNIPIFQTCSKYSTTIIYLIDFILLNFAVSTWLSYFFLLVNWLGKRLDFWRIHPSSMDKSRSMHVAWEGWAAALLRVWFDILRRSGTRWKSLHHSFPFPFCCLFFFEVNFPFSWNTWRK